MYSSSDSLEPDVAQWYDWMDHRQLYITHNQLWHQRSSKFLIAVLYNEPCDAMMVLELSEKIAHGNPRASWKVVVFVHDLSKFSHVTAVLKKYCQKYIDQGILELVIPSKIDCGTMVNYLDCTSASRSEFINAISLLYYTREVSEFVIFVDRCFRIEQAFVTEVEGIIDEVQNNHWITVELYPYGMTGSLMRNSEIEQYIPYALKYLSSNPDGYLHISDILLDYIDHVHPPCDGVVTNHCLQELGLSRIIHHPSLINVTSVRSLKDTNHVLKREAWPWMDAPIYVNPPCRSFVKSGQVKKTKY